VVDAGQKGGESLLSRLRRIVYWVLPLAILTVILTRIDLGLLVETVRGADPWRYALGVLFFPMTLVIGAIRWRVLVRQYLGITERLGFLFRHYSIGLSVSIFLPGQIGMDIYRIALASRRYQRYTPNIALALEEKFLSMVTVMSLVLGTTPWLSVEKDASILGSITDVASGVLMGCAVALAVVWLVAKLAALRRVTEMLSVRLQRVFLSMMRRLKMDTSRLGPLPPLAEIFAPMRSPGKLLPVIVLSVCNFLSLAIGNQLFLSALGYELPFVVSLFVVSVLFFAVSLPISFAGFGVREGAYILLLGMFGVPAESGLVVSFFALSAMLLNYALGGIMIYATGKDRVELASGTG
jgi:uncharacterized membrane protein YbhN (UPF0104 family)